MNETQGQQTQTTSVGTTPLAPPVSIALEGIDTPAQPGLSTRVAQLEEKIAAIERKLEHHGIVGGN